jgi:prepilin-type N-terminal cleavage/methylation domain-containing protein
VSPLGRRGLTLIELLVTLALLGVVTAGICQVLMTSQRAYQAQAQRVDLQQNLRAAAAILPAEFRALDAADSDITAMSATSITMRRTQQLGFLCAAPQLRADGEVTLSVRQRPFFGVSRSFSAGDSVLLYYEGDLATRIDDDWVRGEVVAVSSRDCSDPDHARPGYELGLRLQWASGGSETGVTNGSPLRGFTTVTYALYASPADKQWYVGQQLEDGTIQPLIGPLIGPSGLTLSYYDSTGTPTATPTAVAEVEIRVRGRTALPVHTRNLGGIAYVVDSLVTRVALRNNQRR